MKPRLGVDTEVIAAIIADYIAQGDNLAGVADKVFELCEGVISCLCLLLQKENSLPFPTMEACLKAKWAVMFFASEAATLP